tara:strand:+ start:103 stop:204 length:102 start_codon:yes stop_codon:yes gene_type:complete
MRNKKSQEKNSIKVTGPAFKEMVFKADRKGGDF